MERRLSALDRVTARSPWARPVLIILILGTGCSAGVTAYFEARLGYPVAATGQVVMGFNLLAFCPEKPRVGSGQSCEGRLDCGPASRVGRRGLLMRGVWCLGQIRVGYRVDWSWGAPWRLRRDLPRRLPGSTSCLGPMISLYGRDQAAGCMVTMHPNFSSRRTSRRVVALTSVWSR